MGEDEEELLIGTPHKLILHTCLNKKESKYTAPIASRKYDMKTITRHNRRVYQHLMWNSTLAPTILNKNPLKYLNYSLWSTEYHCSWNQQKHYVANLSQVSIKGKINHLHALLWRKSGLKKHLDACWGDNMRTEQNPASISAPSSLCGTFELLNMDAGWWGCWGMLMPSPVMLHIWG